MAKGNGHLEWESSKDEKYAEKWWTEHGFTWTLKKRFISYSQYEVCKDGTAMLYDIPSTPGMNMKRFMEGPAGFSEAWNINVEYQQLFHEAKAKGLR